MLYIQLPDSVCPTNVQQNEDGYYYFEVNDQTILLKDLAAFAEDGVYDIDLGDGNHLMGTVTQKCPNEDRNYAEYLPKANKPSQWYSFVNGIEKNKFNAQTANSSRSWTSTEQYSLLSSTRKKEVQEARKEQKEDRYEKGPKGW